MKRISIKLFNVHSTFKVKFCIIVDKDNDLKKPEYMQQKTIAKFAFNGNEYTNINVFPMVIFDISKKSDKADWSNNNMFSVGSRELFLFIMKLEELWRLFKTEKSLFYMDKDKLILNTNISDKYILRFHAYGNKLIQLQPCIVYDENSSGYEGIYLAINSMNYSSYLTYSELEYLIYELKKININLLTVELFNTYLLTEKNDDKIEKVERTISEDQPLEIEDLKTNINLQNKPGNNMIPNI